MTETSMQPDGLTQRVVLNILEAFFRRPFMHLIPLVLLVAVGVFTGLNTTKEYQSVGVLNVTSGALLADLTDSAGAQPFGFETPALVTSRNLDQLIQTRTFLNLVIERAGLTTAVTNGLLTRDEIKSSITAAAGGDNLVLVSATTPRAEQSQRLAEATVMSFVNYVVNNDIADQTVRNTAREAQRDDYLARFVIAQQEQRDYAIAHPEPTTGERPVEEALELTRLSENVTRAEQNYADAQSAVDEARVATEAARSVVERQLRVVDAPEVPASPQPRLQKAALTMVMFGVLGALLSLALVVVTALLDRTIRIPNDISAKFGLDVLATIPSARRR